MAKLRKTLPSPALVVASLALLVALGGTGYAATALARNSVTTVHVRDFSLLARDFRRGQLPRGTAIRWALVFGNGQIVAQSGGISLRSRVGPGYYVMDFGQPVTGRLILSAPGSEGLGNRGVSFAGPCTTTAEGDNCATGNDPRFVRVITQDPNHGGREDHSFYVAVFG